MKFLKFIAMVVIGVACCMAISSCSDDKDEPSGGESNPVNPTTVFVNGIPKQVGNMAMSTNNDGLVSHIADGNVNVAVTYSYLSRANASDVIINIDESDKQCTVNVSLNSLGYSKYWKTIWKGGDWEERWFEYNSDGQLQKMKISNSEGSGSIDFIYANGNIANVKMSPADGGTMTLSYGNTPIKNNGGIMLYQIYGIDDTAMQYAYYIGILGKGTVNLPVKNDMVFDGDRILETYDWILNENGMPTKMTLNHTEPDYTDTEEMLFKW